MEQTCFQQKNNIFGILNLIIMKTKSFLRVALIVTAIILVLVAIISTISIRTSTLSAFDAGAATGKIVIPYLAGLGVIFIILHYYPKL